MRQQRKRLVGRVTSDKMQKTVVVTVNRTEYEPRRLYWWAPITI